MDYSFTDHRLTGGVAADARYWEGLEEGRFLLPRCTSCARWVWPAHWRCGECGSWDMGWQDVDPVGTVYAWTRTWYSFERIKERADQVPYVVALVELPAAGGSRVLGVWRGDESALRIGAPVRGTIDPPSPRSKHHAAIRWSLDPAGSGDTDSNIRSEDD